MGERSGTLYFILYTLYFILYTYTAYLRLPVGERSTRPELLRLPRAGVARLAAGPVSDRLAREVFWAGEVLAGTVYLSRYAGMQYRHKV